MSMNIEHDYIGLSSETNPSKKKGGSLELRLGLPGSESPERHDATKICAKRGFSDAISDRSLAGNWGFSDGSDGGGKSDSNNQTALRDGAPPESPKPAMHENIASKPPPQNSAPASKAQVVGWPPIRASRKNLMASQTSVKNGSGGGEDDVAASGGCLYVKVSMDGAPYLRKVDLKNYPSYADLSSALEKMFSCFTIGQCGSTNAVSSRDGLSKSRLMDLLHGSEFVLTYEDKDGDWMLVGDVPWKMFTESCKRLRIMKSSDAIGLAPRAMEKCKNRN